jgi:hypothetical protein
MQGIGCSANTFKEGIWNARSMRLRSPGVRLYPTPGLFMSFREVWDLSCCRSSAADWHP